MLAGLVPMSNKLNLAKAVAFFLQRLPPLQAAPPFLHKTTDSTGWPVLPLIGQVYATHPEYEIESDSSLILTQSYTDKCVDS